MRRCLIFAFCLLLPAIAGWAQAPTQPIQITVRNLTLNGATQISPSDQSEIANEVKQHPYTESSLSEVSQRVSYALQERGFFKAATAPPQIKIVRSSSSEEVIDLAYDVNLGKQYRLQEITFSNNHVFSASELRQMFPIQDGAIFGTDSIRIGLQKLRELYGNKGYVNCTPVPNIEDDNRTATISLRIDLDEGRVFRVGRLMLDGIEPVPGAGAKLMESWKVYQGRVYNDSLIQDFMRVNAAYLRPDSQLFPLGQDGTLHLLNFRLDLGDVATSVR